MTVATRILPAARGGTSQGFVTRRILDISTAPHGGWTQIPDPKAFYYSGKTYLQFGNGSNGNMEIAAWSHSTESLSSIFTLHAALESPADLHDSGSVILRTSDRKLLAAYSQHGDPKPRMRISSNAEDVSSFAAEFQPGSSFNFTYQTLVETANGIYWFHRHIPSGSSPGQLSYQKSTDNGATWATEVILYTGATGKVPYWRIGTDWSRYVHILTTEDVPTASSLYHFYLDTNTDLVYQSDGTQITATQPFGVSALTPVLTTGGACWSWGVAIDSGTGYPSGVVMQDTGSTDNRIVWVGWNGSSWDHETVIASVGGQVTGNQYASGAAIAHDDPNTVYYAKKVSSTWEMFRSVRNGGFGSTWVETQLTSSSSSDNLWPEVPAFAVDGLRAVWSYGTYTSDTSFSFGIRGVTS